MSTTDKSAAQALFDANLALAYHTASKKHGQLFSGYEHITLDDAIQECLLALWDAANAYDASTGYAFSSLAVKCMVNALVILQRRQRSKDKPTSRGMVYLDAPVGEKKEYTLGEVIPGSESTEASAITQADLDIALSSSRPEVCAAYRLREEGLTYRQIGERLGVTRTSAMNWIKELRQALKGGA